LRDQATIGLVLTEECALLALDGVLGIGQQRIKGFAIQQTAIDYHCLNLLDQAHRARRPVTQACKTEVS